MALLNGPPGHGSVTKTYPSRRRTTSPAFSPLLGNAKNLLSSFSIGIDPLLYRHSVNVMAQCLIWVLLVLIDDVHDGQEEYPKVHEHPYTQ
jgi:hypothetical protein